MWCSSCRADVAAELSTDNRRMLCSRCQMELGLAAIEAPRVAVAPRTVEAERDARELLARWSAQNLEAPPTVSASSFPKPRSAEPGEVKLEGRVDQSIGSLLKSNIPYKSAFQEQTSSSSSLKPPQDAASIREPDSTPEPIDLRKKKYTSRSREAESSSSRDELGLPSDDSRQAHDRVVLEALQKQLNRGSNWATLAGQLCAYGGVALLTCGTVLVMWSYFGGPPNYMPTGWLTAAVGQMLLFLGVVTLISSGMEQTVHEVSWRIDSLADEIHRMRQSLEQLEQDGLPSRRHRSSGTRGRTREDRPREVA